MNLEKLVKMLQSMLGNPHSITLDGRTIYLFMYDGEFIAFSV